MLFRRTLTVELCPVITQRVFIDKCPQAFRFKYAVFWILYPWIPHQIILMVITVYLKWLLSYYSWRDVEQVQTSVLKWQMQI